MIHARATRSRAPARSEPLGPTARRRIVPAAAYAVFLLVGLLAPFDVYRLNDAGLSERGLEFNGRGIARSVAPPLRIHDRLVTTGALTVEVRAEPAGTLQSGPARLVSYSESTSRRNFTLAQEGADLHVRLRTTQSGLNGTEPFLTVEDVFSRPGPRHIVLTYDGTEERVYVDGALRRSSRALRGSFDNWDPGHELVLGNEASGTRPWRGWLGLVAIYDRALGPDEVATNHARETAAAGTRVVDGLVALYQLGGASPDPPDERDGHVRDGSGLAPPADLTIPRYVHVERPFLDTDREYVRGRFVAAEADEIAVNLAIFVPLGFLVARIALASAARVAAVAAVTLASGVLLSLGAETAQYFLVSRHSELGDVLVNGIGTLLGLLLALAIARRRRRPAPA